MSVEMTVTVLPGSSVVEVDTDCGVKLILARQNELRSITSMPPQFSSIFFLANSGLISGVDDIEIALGRALIALGVAVDAALGAIAQHLDRLADIAVGIVGELLPVHDAGRGGRRQEQSGEQHGKMFPGRQHGGGPQ